MEPIRIVLVTAKGCHFCDEALEMLNALGGSFALSVETIPLASDTGRALVVKHRVPFPPLLIVDGAFFGHGRVSRRRLKQRLTQLAGLRSVG